MENLMTFLEAFFMLFTDVNVLLLMLGATALGVIIGALPGLTATMGIALLTGLTYNVPLEYTFTILMGVYVGGIYGGSISAILLNIPGTASAAATALDGHQLALQGKAETAIKVTRLASIIGTMIGVLALAMLAPPLTKIALKFTSPEYFMLAFFGVLICGSVAADDLSIKGWVAGLIGILLAFVRLDDLESIPRFTFDNFNLFSGIAVIPAMIGFYAIPEVIKAFAKTDDLEVTEAKDTDTTKINVFTTVFSKMRVIIQSALIGLGLGALTLHGIRPGPMINIESPGFISEMAALIMLGIIALWVVGMILAKPMAKILKIPIVYLMPVVAALSVIGAYAINLSKFDLIMVFIFGVLGYFLSKMCYSPAPIVLGLILCNMIDVTFRRTLITSNGSFLPFVTRPIALIFFVFIAITIVSQVRATIKRTHPIEEQ